MSAKRVAVYGTSANPPAIHHLAIVQRLAAEFDRVLVVPCGLRRDKMSITVVEPVHRAAMADLTFGRLPNVAVLHFDLEQELFTPTIELEKRLASYGQLWHVVGADLITGGRDGKSAIHGWVDGLNVWQNLRFVVVDREEYPIDEVDLPPHCQRIQPGHSGSSEAIRQRLHRLQPITGLVTPEVERYIERYSLYRGAPSPHASRYKLDEPRIMIVADDRKPATLALAEELNRVCHIDPRHPEVIVVLGGDGTMLHAIRQHWRMRVPFLGVNYGTIGFLLNDYPSGFSPAHLLDEWVVEHSPLLFVESVMADGQTRHDIAFNDAYLFSRLGETGWTEISLDDHVVVPLLMSDGSLVATAGGSGAYARSMGAAPIAVGTQNLVLVGNNVSFPVGWKQAHVPIDTVIRLRNADPTPHHDKRPLFGFIDGQALGQVNQMTIRSSRIAAAELAFLEASHPRKKLLKLQFPQM